MSNYNSFLQSQVSPRNGHTSVVLIVARISGCPSQKELSLDDQVDHAKEVIEDIYDGDVVYKKGDGAWAT
jgi:hypothetical protein